jgi:hypothetical protein
LCPAEEGNCSAHAITAEDPKLLKKNDLRAASGRSCPAWLDDWVEYSTGFA